MCLEYTGHPLVDIGIATITAFAGKESPTALTIEDLDAIADYMEANYVVDPLKSFLTVAFPNSGFTQPAYDKTPKKRDLYAKKVLRAYRPETPKTDERCIFTGKPAIKVSLDVKDELSPGRTFRQHVPLVTGEDVINFHPNGDAGLPISGEALLAIHAFPLGCGKVEGRLLGVYSPDTSLMQDFAGRFLYANRKAIQQAQQSGEKKLPETSLGLKTLLISWLQDFERARLQKNGGATNSLTAYHLTNSGQGADLAIYHIPIAITEFLRTVNGAAYKDAWDKLCARGWEITSGQQGKSGNAPREPRFNVLYEDLLRLPDNSQQFVRKYLLRLPARAKRSGDPSSSYSLRSESDLVSWKITELFLRKVMLLDSERIGLIKIIGDDLAEYIKKENDKKLFHQFLTAKSYAAVRSILIKVGMKRVQLKMSPIVGLDTFVKIFEEDDQNYTNWRLVRDLILIRVIERLYELGWMQGNVDDLPDMDEYDDDQQKEWR